MVRLASDRAECLIVAVGDLPLAEKFRGVIRKQDVRFFEAGALGTPGTPGTPGTWDVSHLLKIRVDEGKGKSPCPFF